MDKRSTQEKQQEAIEGFLREILGPLTRDKPKHLDDLIALLRSRGVGKSKSLHFCQTVPATSFDSQSSFLFLCCISSATLLFTPPHPKLPSSLVCILINILPPNMCG